MRGLKGKVAVVAGGAPGGIGGATAVRLAEEGMSVVVADLNESAAQKVAAEIRKAGGEATARQFDITNEDSYAGLIDFTVRTYGRLDGLYNVAADLSPATMNGDVDVTSVPLDLWQRALDINLTGYMLGIRHALPVMLGQGSGSIVNTMSSAVWGGGTTKVAYQASKSGLLGLTRHTASLGGKQGVRCNLLSPGVTLTTAALASTTEEWRDQVLASVRSPRLGKPEDMAAMVAFLFSDDAAFINGQSFLVDGGAHFS
ncbi:SDR family NAD(P)-dependent oxidoreductase [Streptomyces sp. NPDC051286]|uniref:SDR family NAD(P)-dependent oxidoreductase n=1 Tax=Streptomyces sp. NPDC051286 TaxID=3365647 RepID=UPI0037950943